MAAYFSAATVLGSLLTFLACVATILAGLGGINQPALKDMPWLQGSVSVTIQQTAIANRFWMGLWNYCSDQTLPVPSVKCAPLVNGTENQLNLLAGNASPASQSNIQVDGFTTTFVIALPYIHMGSAFTLFITFLFTFMVEPPTLAFLTFIATAVQSAAFGSALYFTLSVKKRVEQELGSPLSFNGLLAAVGSHSEQLGMAAWISAAATGLMLFSFLFFFATACCGAWSDRRKYRQSIYY